MDVLIDANRYVHVIVGFAGLAAWWVPVFTKKGAAAHRRFGMAFVAAAYVIGVTSILSGPMRIGRAVAEGVPWQALEMQAAFLIFLGYIGVLTLNFVHFGVAVLRTRRDHPRLASPALRALTWLMMGWSVASAIFAVVFWTPASIIMLALAPPGIVQGLHQRRYMKQPPAQSKPWFYAHMDAMLGAGIGFHTAFLVFGSRAIFDYSVLGPFNWVPWVLPSVIGTIGGNAWRRSYMRKFGDLPQPAVAGAQS